MKRFLMIYAFAILGSTLSAQTFSVKDAVVKKVKQNTEISFEVENLPALMRSRHKLVLRPYLFNGSDTAWLSQAQIYGRIRYKRERQEAALNGNRDRTLSSNEVIAKKDTLRYKDKTDYKRWMKNASLGVHCRLVGCGKCQGKDIELLSNASVYTVPIARVVESKANPKNFEVIEAKKRWAFKKEMKVYFPASKIVLHLDKYGNKKTLDEIVAGIRKIGDMEQLRLQGVEITGFASPEGTLALNTRLGEKRAIALEEYIQQEVPELQDKDFRLINGVENWDGLRDMVASSDMEYKNEVLAILDNKNIRNRKSVLMNLHGGKPYRYMLKEFFPELRNACYISVFYDVLGDKVANTINDANTLIKSGKFREALTKLMEYEYDDRAFNSIGVCHMMLEEEDEAVIWFEKAIKAGHLEAERNLQQIK